MSEPAEFFLQQLPLIERVIRFISRRYQMSFEDIDDFSAEVKLRLIVDDYAIVRKYQARSSFATYIAAVAMRLAHDYRIRQRGRWFPSASARELGPLAVDLERCLYRDGRTLDEAMQAVRARWPKVQRAELEALADKLPPRSRRRHIELDDEDPELAHTATFPVEHEGVAARISDSVRAFVDGLSETDRRILRLRFDAEMPVAEIARALGLDQKLVYRRLYGLFRNIRAKLEAEGFDRSDVDALVGNDAAPLDFHLRSENDVPSRDTHDAWEKSS